MLIVLIGLVAYRTFDEINIVNHNISIYCLFLCNGNNIKKVYIYFNIKYISLTSLRKKSVEKKFVYKNITINYYIFFVIC